MRKILMAAALAALGFGGVAATTTEANAQYVQFGIGPGPGPGYYGPRPDYGPRRHYRPRHYYGEPRYVRPAPRCRYETRWVDGRYGPQRRTYQVCR